MDEVEVFERTTKSFVKGICKGDRLAKSQVIEMVEQSRKDLAMNEPPFAVMAIYRKLVKDLTEWAEK